MRMSLQGAGLLAVCAMTIAVPAADAGSKPPKAVVSITFDDGKPTVFTNAFPVLAARNYPATMYVITGELGTVDWHLSLEQAQILRQYRWEIGSHTVTHPNLTKITPIEALRELENSRDALAKLGFPSTSFASPFGEVNPTVLQLVRQTYKSHRHAWGPAGTGGLNSIRGFDPYDISALEVTRDTKGATVIAALDKAVTEQKWLVLLFHHITEGPIEHHTQVSAKLFREIVDQIAQRAEFLEVRTVGDHVAVTGKR